MPLFSSATPFDADVEKATNELNTTEDWGLFLDICDRAKQSSSAAKDCLKSIVKRLNDRVPFVALQALTLLSACVKNCGHIFHLEIASRDFINECKALIGEKAHPKVALQLKLLIKTWAEGEFKSDSSLSLIPSFYLTLKIEGHSFVPDEIPKTRVFSKDPNVVASQEEEEDIAKAIALSMKDAEKQKSKSSTSSSSSSSSSLYPNFSSNSASGAASLPKSREPRKVKALYDFEAAEDNELTFKAGEIIGVLDDSDPNWWKGVSWRGEGLFPANFVSPDLTTTVDEPVEEEVPKVEEVEVPKVVWIDEEKINQTLSMIQNADPTGERCPDSPDMIVLEEECRQMGPLIDQELEKIDRSHGNLMELNGQLMEALQLYHNLMMELPSYGYSTMTLPPSGFSGAVVSPPPAPSPVPPPSYMSINQMFPTQSMSLGQIPQGITAQVGPSSIPSHQQSMPTAHANPFPAYQQHVLPAYYDLYMQQGMPNSHNMGSYGPPMMAQGPASLPYSGVPGYSAASPPGMASPPHPQQRLV